MPRWTWGLLFLLLGNIATAGEVEIVMSTWHKRGDTWNVDTTLRHADTGWEHYADAWRVVTDQGTVLGTRTLLHPHEDEQPFTRSLDSLVLPPELYIIYIEAHDTVHGWSTQRLRVNLRQESGERFQVRQ